MGRKHLKRWYRWLLVGHGSRLAKAEKKMKEGRKAARQQQDWTDQWHSEIKAVPGTRSFVIMDYGKGAPGRFYLLTLPEGKPKPWDVDVSVLVYHKTATALALVNSGLMLFGDPVSVQTLDISWTIPCQPELTQALEGIGTGTKLGVTKVYKNYAGGIKTSNGQTWSFLGYRKVEDAPETHLEKNMVCFWQTSSKSNDRGCCVTKKANKGSAASANLLANPASGLEVQETTIADSLSIL